MNAAAGEPSADQAGAEPGATWPGADERAASQRGDPELATFARSLDQGHVEALPLKERNRRVARVVACDYRNLTVGNGGWP
jgi:hypothetical protein